MTERKKFPLWAVAASMLLACGAAYTGGRVYGQQCVKTCLSYAGGKNDCVYSGATGQILKPTNGDCLILAWRVAAGSGTTCIGSVTSSADTCVGEGSYCHAPGSSEYADIDCGTCSGSTTLSCCSSCM